MGYSNIEYIKMQPGECTTVIYDLLAIHPSAESSGSAENWESIIEGSSCPWGRHSNTKFPSPSPSRGGGSQHAERGGASAGTQCATTYALPSLLATRRR